MKAYPSGSHGLTLEPRGWQGPGQSSSALRPGEILLWCLVAGIALFLRAGVVGGPSLSNDGYQYLATAHNFLRGDPAATSIVHFDTERLHGRIPAPLTTFPAGYPALIAFVSAAGVGVEGEHAAVLLSFLAVIALIPMYARAARLLGAPPAAARGTIALLVASSSWLATGYQVSTEALFTSVSFAALLLLLEAESRNRSTRDYVMLQLWAGLLVAGAFWLRYAGLFLFAATALFQGGRWLAKPTRRALYAVVALFLPAVLIGAGLWRNHVLVGSWKGGNTKDVELDVLGLPVKFARAMHHLFFGDTQLSAAQALIALAFAAFLAAGLRALWRARGAIVSEARGQLLGIYVAVYVAAMLYLGADSMISFSARMFVPILPLLLLLACGLWAHAALVFARAPWPRVHGALSVLVAAYACVNVVVLFEVPDAMPHQRVSARLNAPVFSGESLRQVIEREVAPEAVLLAADGQATGFVLGRKVVSLVSPQYSDLDWNEKTVRATMIRFGARHLLVYAEQEASSAFLGELVRGAAPAWLKLVAENRQARLYFAEVQ
jgi:hypothetical protein